jgi:acetolactate synthase-1/2/3 large subunit
VQSKTINGSEIILETLLELGVDTVFGYPGGAVLNIYDALYKYEKQGKIKHFLTSHEQHAGHAADGYARATGKTGVVIATSGPGASNLVTALASAYMDSSPVVAITGNVSQDLLGLASFQELDIVGITMSVTKHNFLVTDITKLADTIRDAFKIAETGRKGPVLIDIPKDITAAVCEYFPQGNNSDYGNGKWKIRAGEKEINTARDMLAKSERPFVYAGGGVISANAGAELSLLSEKLGAPVACSLMGHGAVDHKWNNYIGMLGMHGTPAAAYAFEHSDLILAVGARFSDRVTGDKNLFGEKKIIHIDIDNSEHGKNIPTELDIEGDAKTVLAQLIPLVEKRADNGWVAEVRTKSRHFPKQAATPEYPVTPFDVLHTLSDITEGNAIITTEVGQNQMWAAEYYTYRAQRSFISSGGLGTMGFGLGAAVGAKIGVPDKDVVCVSGDGSFGMNLNELSTLARYNIPVKILLFNNGVLGMVRQWQKLFYDARFSHTILSEQNGYSGVDYNKLAAAFGIKYVRIDTKESIETGLKTAIEYNAPVLVEVITSPDYNVLPMVFPGKDITKPIYEM